MTKTFLAHPERKTDDLITMTSKVKQMQQLLQAVTAILLAHIIRSSDQLLAVNRSKEIRKSWLRSQSSSLFPSDTIEVLPSTRDSTVVGVINWTRLLMVVDFRPIMATADNLPIFKLSSMVQCQLTINLK